MLALDMVAAEEGQGGLQELQYMDNQVRFHAKVKLQLLIPSAARLHSVTFYRYRVHRNYHRRIGQYLWPAGSHGR